MMLPRSYRTLITVLLAAMGLATSAAAQTNTEIFQDFQWNFATPGARANGIGRAFIGVADDATAAVTNPAGLVSLTRPQGYFEFKNTNLDIQRLAARDAVLTRQTTPFGDTINAVSFFSVAFPLGNGIAVSFAGNQFLNYQETFSYPPRVTANPGFFFPVEARSDFRGTSYAGSIAAALGDKVRVGVTASVDRLTASSELTRFAATGSGLTAVTTTTVVNRTIIPKTTATSGSVTVGGLYRPNEKISLGVIYAKGPTFKLSESYLDPNGNQQIAPNSAGLLVTFPQDLTFHVPSRAGVGVAIRPEPRLLVAFDAVRIQYADLVKDFTVTTNFRTQNPRNFTIRNTTEVHLGGEYNLVTGDNPLFVRAGMFTNPDHGLTFVPTSDVAAAEVLVAIDQFNLLPQKTRVFGTVGAGFVVGRRLQVDVAYVSSKEFVASVGVRF